MHQADVLLCVRGMRTNIEIDDALIGKALALTGPRTKKKAVVEEALRLLVRLKEQEKLKDLFGKVPSEGDLDAVRRDRFFGCSR